MMVIEPGVDAPGGETESQLPPEDVLTEALKLRALPLVASYDDDDTVTVALRVMEYGFAVAVIVELPVVDEELDGEKYSQLLSDVTKDEQYKEPPVGFDHERVAVPPDPGK